MYSLDLIIKHPQNAEAKIVVILKAKAKRKPNFNDEELDVNLSQNQTQNPNLDHHQIPCQNRHDLGKIPAVGLD